MPVMEDVYPSRVDGQVRVTERVDPVVYSDPGKPGRLSPAELASYEANGFLVQKELFKPEEIADLNAELRRLCSSEEIKDMDETIAEPESREVRSIFRIHKLNPLFERLSRDPRVLEVAEQLLGGRVYIHQSRVNLKPGFIGKEFYWHSDFETWHVEDGMPRMRAVSVSISLTPNYPFNGPLMLIPGSHKLYISCAGQTPEDHYKDSLRRQEYGVPDNESLRKMADEGGIAAPTGPAGTVVFFECNTMHGSNSNISPYPRSNVFMVYNNMENTLQEPFCGLKPRPEHIATRERFEPVRPLHE